VAKEEDQGKKKEALSVKNAYIASEKFMNAQLREDGSI